MSITLVRSKLVDGLRMVQAKLEPELHCRHRSVVVAKDTSAQDWLARVVDKAITEKWLDSAIDGELV